VKIPNAENAVVDIRKLRDYCLDPEHPTGKHKATLFKAALGITVDDADALRNILLAIVKTHEAEKGKADEYGQRYRVDFELGWKEKSAVVRSAWIIEVDSDVPRLTSCYPL
jgi:hypothetical protein